MCETDEIRLQLLRLWEESLYLEFSESRQDSSGGSSPAALSSSMRYKLRKKFPCPVELDQELRVKNARLPKPVHDGLNNWLKENRENPYPNKREKENLASKLGITPQQVRAFPASAPPCTHVFVLACAIPCRCSIGVPFARG